MTCNPEHDFRREIEFCWKSFQTNFGIGLCKFYSKFIVDAIEEMALVASGGFLIEILTDIIAVPLTKDAGIALRVAATEGVTLILSEIASTRKIF